MNAICTRKCEFKELCNLNETNTALCKVADDKEAQEFHASMRNPDNYFALFIRKSLHSK